MLASQANGPQVASLAERGPYLTVLLDRDQTIVEIAGDVDAIFGARYSDLLGRRPDDLISRRDRKGRRAYNEAISEPAGGYVELRAVLELRDQELLCRLRLRREGAGWLMVVENLLAEENERILDLELSREQWRSIVTRSEEGVAVLDAEDRILELNQRFLTLGDFRSRHGVLLNEEALLESELFEQLPEMFDELHAAVDTGRTRKRHRFSGTLRHAGRQLQVFSKPIHLPVRGYVGASVVLRDVTSEWRLRELSEMLRCKNLEIQTILENLEQGIFTIGSELEVQGEHSRYLSEILGTALVPGDNGLDKLLASVKLGDDERDQIECALSCCLNGGTLDYQLNAHLLPRELVSGEGERAQVLEVDWTPVVSDSSDDIEQMMITLRDVTQLRRLQGEHSRRERELEMISQLLRLTPDAVHAFATRAHRSLGSVDRCLAAMTSPVPADLADVFRTMHTLKGLARFHGLAFLADKVHVAETCLSLHREQRELPWNPRELRDQVDVVRSTLDEYMTINRDTLMRQAGGEQAELARQREEVASLLGVLEELDDCAGPKVVEIKQRLRTLSFVPLRSVLRGVFDAIPNLARELEVEPPEVILAGAEVRISPDLAQPLCDVFIHLVNNALDHGIEPAAERVASGKDPRGTFTIVASLEGDEAVIRVSDDGRGLDLGAIRERGGLDVADDSEIADLVFRPGLTTKEKASLVSGRGVGLDAVRQHLLALGGNARARLLDRKCVGQRRALAIELRVPGDAVAPS